MAWGNYGHPSVRLNYSALNQALIDKEKTKTGWTQYRSILFLHGHGSRAAVTAYRHNENTIALKLYRTEIIHYHENELRTLYGAGWIGHNTTRHWFWQANININGIQPNRWSRKQYAIWPSKCVFYDGVQIDQSGEVISKHKPVEIRTPNAEAKELRKRLTKLAQFYKPYAMLDSNRHYGYFNKYHESTIANIDLATHEVDLELYKQLNSQSGNSQDPYQRVLRSLAEVYKREVFRRELFNVKEVRK